MVDNQALTVHLLGGFHITAGHEKVTGLDQARLQRLLVYLLLHRRAPRPRQQIEMCIRDRPCLALAERSAAGRRADF